VGSSILAEDDRPSWLTKKLGPAGEATYSVDFPYLSGMSELTDGTITGIAGTAPFSEAVSRDTWDAEIDGVLDEVDEMRGELEKERRARERDRRTHRKELREQRKMIQALEQRVQLLRSEMVKALTARVLADEGDVWQVN
jgi:hypothetical protein